MANEVKGPFLTIIAESFGPGEGATALPLRSMVADLVQALSRHGIDVGTTHSATPRVVRLTLRVGAFPGAPESWTVQYGQTSGAAGRHLAMILAERLQVTTGQPWPIQRVWGTLVVMGGDVVAVPSVAIYLGPELGETETRQVREAIVQAMLLRLHPAQEGSTSTVPQAMPTTTPDPEESAHNAALAPTPPAVPAVTDANDVPPEVVEPPSEPEGVDTASAENPPSVQPELRVEGFNC